MKRLLVCLFVMALCLSLFPVTAEAATVAEGDFGREIKWSLDDSGVLSIYPAKKNGSARLFYAYERPWDPYAEQITELHLCKGITYVPDVLFAPLKNIHTLTMESVTEIQAMAFNTFPALEHISWGVIETIGEGAFAGNDSLKEVVLPDTLTTMGDFAFGYCENLISVEIPALETIPTRAFIECKNLERVSAPQTVTVGESAFSGCLGLNTVSMPTVRTVGKEAFRSCESLETITLPEALTVGESAFLYCASLAQISLPKAERLELSAFESTPALKTFSAPVLTLVGEKAFRYSGLETVTLESALTLETDAFRECPNLRQVSLPAATVVGETAFYGAELLAEVSIPSIVTVEDDAFHFCKALASISLPETLEFLGQRAFCYSGLVEITFPASLAETEKAVLAECPNLKKAVFLGDTVLGHLFFEDSTALETVEMDRIQTVPAYCFSNCGSLTGISMENATRIESNAFYLCKSLRSITAPKVTHIEHDAFYLSGLTEAAFGELEVLDYGAFSYCASLRQLDLGNVTVIDGVFNGCTALESVTMSPKLEEIGPYTFHDCVSLTTITLPASLKAIGIGAFQDCTALKTVFFEGPPPAFHGEYDASPFVGVTATVFYPAGEPLWAEDKMQNYGGTLTWSNGVHSHSFTESTTPPTCTEPGLTVKACECGAKEETILPALNHRYLDGLCTRCGEEQKAIPGDADGNGTLSYNDALIVLRASIGLEDLLDPGLGDVDDSGTLSYNDALIILRRSIGLE